MSDDIEQYMVSSADYSQAWQDLVTSALLGTGRRGVAVRHRDDALGAVLAAVGGESAEERLLGSAAVVSAYGRAGDVTQLDNRPAVEPCAPDEMPPCSGRAGQHLSAMLRGHFQELLGEWLQAAAKASKRAPEELLPALLELGRINASFREAIGPVLDKRGLWLAAQNAEWQSMYLPVPVEGDNSVWETSDRNTRTIVLAALRTREPARARELVAEAWPREAAETRAAFLRSFERNLSMDDEPFLESALDDKSKQVREIAAELLARLPESRLVSRMVERVKRLLKMVVRGAGGTGYQPYGRHVRPAVGGPEGTPPIPQEPIVEQGARAQLIEKKAFGRTRYEIRVTLPEQLDKSAIRDGLQTKARMGQGEKAGWLIEMLGCVPPAVWCEEWDRKPEEIIEAALSSEWKDALLGGWIVAASNFKDVEWAEALLARGPGQVQGFDSTALLSLLAPERREALIMDIMTSKANPLASKELTLTMLWRLQTPWSAEMSRAALRAVRTYLDSTARQGDWEMRGSLIYFARAISPAILTEAAAILDSDAANRTFYNESLDKFASTVQFRQEMLGEFPNVECGMSNAECRITRGW